MTEYVPKPGDAVHITLSGVVNDSGLINVTRWPQSFCLDRMEKFVISVVKAPVTLPKKRGAVIEATTNAYPSNIIALLAAPDRMDKRWIAAYPDVGWFSDDEITCIKILFEGVDNP